MASSSITDRRPLPMAYDLVFDTKLSDTEGANYYYLDVLRQRASPRITSVSMRVDRGIGDFDSFRIVLMKFYPNLRRLKIVQNYSYGVAHTQTNFFDFILGVKLSEFIFEDCQSRFMQDLAMRPADLLDRMPDSSTYEFTSGTSGTPMTQTFTSGTKTLIWTDLIDYANNKVPLKYYKYQQSAIKN